MNMLFSVNVNIFLVIFSLSLYHVCLTSIIGNEEIHINKDDLRKARWTNWALFCMYMIAHDNKLFTEVSKEATP